MKHVSRIVVGLVLAAALWLMLEQRFGNDGREAPNEEDGIEIFSPEGSAPR